MQRLIIDTDPGVDDAHAILMALGHPQAKVEAITSVAGNVGLEYTTRNAAIILDVAGADVPIYPGCARPLVGGARSAAHVHGHDGLGDAGFTPSARRPQAEHAANALVRLASASPGEISLVAIGPLTNLAVAQQLDLDLPGKFRKVVIMGGAIHSRGNTDNLSAEFNIYSDPEAAQAVLEHWPRLSLISWETTMAYGLPRELLARFNDLGTPRAEFFRRANEKIIAFVQQVLGREMLFAPDGLAMAVALEPGIITRSETHAVSVELHGQHTRGQTTVDWMNRGGRPANVEVVLEVDRERFLQLLEDGLR